MKPLFSDIFEMGSKQINVPLEKKINVSLEKTLKCNKHTKLEYNTTFYFDICAV